MKKRVLRTINSGATLALLIIISGASAIFAVIADSAASKYFYTIAVISMMAILMVIGHKVRRIAKILYALKSTANASVSADSRDAESPVEKAPSPKAELSLIEMKLQNLVEEVKQFRKEQGLTQQTVVNRVESISYATASPVHPNLSAGSVREAAHGVELIRPRSVRIVGNEATKRFVSWLFASTKADAPANIEVIEHDAPIELALSDILLIDANILTFPETLSIKFLGKLLPNAEVWVIGPMEHRLNIVSELNKSDATLMNKVGRNGNREFSILKRLGQ